ncbi:hypothetical protein [Marinibactrum halimedae]|uniref:Uncharacterized protein n=1 Tax=Marinibactrum halimedae TaxID=1444977 RepID=A0AA37WKQ9_9GAMM|nr:hypothetical protein [Marinibactrum halimedae]MCD9459927.1 hypothetical protein [Marinibactrum halimedae]GLS25218.1 hypothetical protein GCM10007877_09320 [Marinibactrum halimedae]
MAVNEAQRLTYLEAMGVDQYLPRRRLPGAPAPIQAEWRPEWLHQLNRSDQSASPVTSARAETESLKTGSPANTALSTTKPSTSKAEISVHPVTNQAVVLNDGAPRSDNRAGVPKAADEVVTDILSEFTPSAQDKMQGRASKAQSLKSPPVSDSAAGNLRFSLSVWRVNDDVLVIDSRHSELALPTETLLRNILRAMGYPPELPRSEVIKWPLIKGTKHDQSESAAREMMQAFLDEQFLLQPGKFIFLMGRDAVRVTVEETNDFESLLGQSIAISDFDVTALVMPSLVELLQSPKMKSIVWQALTPLRKS